MKFTDYKYERPDLEYIKDKYAQLTNEFKNANYERQVELIYEFEKISNDVETQMALVSIRNSINTTDEFYEHEKAYFDNETPLLGEYQTNFMDAFYNSTYKEELKLEFGNHIFKMIETQLKSFSPVIIEDMQLENQLITEYSKLSASAKIEFDGGIKNLSQMHPYLESVDQETRRNAEKAVADFFEKNESKYDEIYSKLVECRNTMATKMGYENYIELGYYRLGRTDYNEKDVANYREQIVKSVVPLASRLVLETAKRIGIENPKSYDLGIEFIDGNPTPKGNCKELVNKAKIMYSQLSDETKEFFDFMTESELLDLEAKEGKQGGGYCNFIPNYQAPFIFSNFNGTKGDVDVLTHEAGHAFQIYSSRNMKLSEYLLPTLEACEIHSMSMEFFAWPWMELFFEEEANKYRYSHLAGTVTFIPYGALVDEFQHEIYSNPKLTADERKETWRRIERKYLPHKVYENTFLDKGTYWYRQGHIFSSPFYYIDYTLAQICAQQFWSLDQVNHKEAWNKYYELCKMGGSKSFLNLISEIGLDNPFVDGTIKKTISPIEKWLDNNK